MKDIDPHKKERSVDERSDFHTEVLGILPYHHRLCMNKGCTFNVSIKCFDDLKISDKE